MSAEFNIDDKDFKKLLKDAKRLLGEQAQDNIVEKTAQEVRRDLINETPSQSGNTRNAWTVTGSRGSRSVINLSPIMRFLEYGTPINNPGGKIYPKNAKALAIPKKAKGRKTSFTQTVSNKSKRKKGSADKFIFVKWTRGIKAKKIVENYTPKIVVNFMANIKEAINRL